MQVWTVATKGKAELISGSEEIFIGEWWENELILKQEKDDHTVKAGGLVIHKRCTFLVLAMDHITSLL